MFQRIEPEAGVLIEGSLLTKVMLMLINIQYNTEITAANDMLLLLRIYIYMTALSTGILTVTTI